MLTGIPVHWRTLAARASPHALKLVVDSQRGGVLKHQKSLVNTIDEDVRSAGAEDTHHATGHITVECIVTAQRVNLLTGKALGQLEERHTLGDAQRLGLWAAGNDATIVVRENHDGFAL